MRIPPSVQTALAWARRLGQEAEFRALAQTLCTTRSRKRGQSAYIALRRMPNVGPATIHWLSRNPLPEQPTKAEKKVDK